MKFWKEVDVRTGQEIDEDAPTTSVANAPPGMVDEPIVRKKKKKKKALFDGRTKSYRQHRERLEAQREKRVDSNLPLYAKARIKIINNDETNLVKVKIRSKGDREIHKIDMNGVCIRMCLIQRNSDLQ